MTQFIHLRRNDPRFEHGVTDPRGGITVAFDLDEDTGLVVSQAAFCNNKDNYNKRLGRVKAAGRLSSNPILGAFDDLKEYRQFIYKFWEAYSYLSNEELRDADWEEVRWI